MHVMPWPHLRHLRSALLVVLVALLALAAFAAGAELLAPSDAPVVRAEPQPASMPPDLSPAPVLLR